MAPQAKDININQTVTFAVGQIPDLLRKIERFYGIPLSLRSNTGEVVVKTDYFNGPCSLIRGSERGRQRCKRSYKNVEDRLFRRKVPFVNICYAGFLVFAIPLEFRGEMVGTLLGSQLLPMDMRTRDELVMNFEHTLLALGIKDLEGFYRSFECVRTIRSDFERVSLLSFLDTVGKHFMSMAFAGKTWEEARRELSQELPSPFRDYDLENI